MAPRERLLRGCQGRLGTALGRHRRGPNDPTHRLFAGGGWRATRTSDGPALLLAVDRSDGVLLQAWGAGARLVLDQADQLFGCTDDVAGFVPRHRIIRELHHRHPGLRIGRTDAVFESLAPACLEQRVTSLEALVSWRQLVRRYGEPAPGPASDPASSAYGMRLPPTPEAWARVPSWDYVRAGVDAQRARTLVQAARRPSSIERVATSQRPRQALESLPGVGAWTSAQVAQRALGDPDAWSIGDYHVPGTITWALTGERLGDAEAEEVLAPYAGHRYRIELLLHVGGVTAPRHGPRMSLATHVPRGLPV